MKNGILNALKMFEAHFKRQIAPQITAQNISV